MSNQLKKIPLLKNGAADVDALMQNIRKEIEETNSTFEIPIPRYISQREKQLLADGTNPSQSEELRYLNDHWGDWSFAPNIQSHRPFLGRIIVKFKRALVNLIWNGIFKEYFEREKTYANNLVRFLNRMSVYTDSRDADIFWKIIDKVDNDVQGINERTDLLVEKLLSELESQKRENAELRKFVEAHIQNSK